MLRYKLHSFTLKYVRNFKTKSFKNSVVNAIDDISLCVVGNGAEGNPRSLFLNYNDKLFMFNCGEGLQRALSCFGLKPSKVDTFFLTSDNWNNLNGLSSILLSRYDAGLKNFDIIGCNNSAVINDIIGFDTKLKNTNICFNHKNEIKFENLTVKPFLLEYNNTKSFIYLCDVLSQKGSLNLQKCFELKVPRHLVSVLENEQSITLQNGDEIYPENVKDPDQPHLKFAILECLHPSFFNSIYSKPSCVDFLQNCECFVHFTSDTLLSCKEYDRFFKKYSSAYHLLLTESNSSWSLQSTHRYQRQLNYLDPQIFPLLKEKESKRTTDNEKIIYCQSGLSFTLRPLNQNKITLYRIPPKETLESSLCYQDGSSRIGLDEEVNKLRKKQQNLPSLKNVNYPEFIFLGTASSISLSIRNVSSILVKLSETESILLDCGENTYGQLLRFFGEENMKTVFQNLKAIFISHHHSDHHMGLIQLIEKYYNLNGKSQNLTVILPPMLSSYLHSKRNSYFNLRNLNKKYNYIINQKFNAYKDYLIKKLNIRNIALIPVDHCAFAYAILIETHSGYKFVYSGDTQPCDELIRMGRKCDLLIHEATVEDNLVHFARNNFHSTVSEAIQVGKSMDAKFVMLTHFSQRYGKLPYLPSEEHRQRVGIAFDFMSVKPDQLNRIPLLYDALKCMYSKHLDNLQYKTELYSRKYKKSID